MSYKTIIFSAALILFFNSYDLHAAERKSVSPESDSGPGVEVVGPPAGEKPAEVTPSIKEEKAEGETPLPAVEDSPLTDDELELEAAAEKVLKDNGYDVVSLLRTIDLNGDKVRDFIFKVRKSDKSEGRRQILAVFSSTTRGPVLFLFSPSHVEDLDRLEIVDFDRDGKKDILVRDKAYRSCSTFVLHNTGGKFKQVFSSSQRRICSPESVPRFSQTIDRGALEIIDYRPIREVETCISGYDETRLLKWNGRSFVEVRSGAPAFFKKQKKRYKEVLTKIEKRINKIKSELSRKPVLYLEYDCLVTAKKKYTNLLKKLK